MANRGVVVAALSLAACALAWPGTLVAQAIQRSMYVSVLNDAGAPVPDLGPTDFVIREDNTAREVLKVAPAEEPMQIAVLVDTSQAARDDISHIRTALPPFFATLTAARHQVSLIAIGERPTVFTNYTTDAAQLSKGIGRIWSLRDSGAYLLDGIVEVCQGFKKREASRPVIVSITTEGPELSNLHYDQVLDALRASGAAFHAVTLGTPSASQSDEVRARNIVLDEGPRTTGGSRDDLLTSMALDTRLLKLANELTHQYRVTYARPQSLIPPERVTVAAAKAGLTARGTVIKEPQGRP